MTIINSFVQGEIAYLLTDMAWFDQTDGRVLANECKFLVGRDFPWALSVTGDGHLRELCAQIGHWAPPNAEAFAEFLPQLLRAAQAMSLDADFTMDLRLATWCEEAKAPKIFHIGTDPHRCALMGIKPWLVYPTTVMVPGDGPVVAALPDIDFSTPATFTDPATFDPERDGVRLVAAQREQIRRPVKYGRKPLTLIGGGVQLACVSQSGVEVKTLHRWKEDRVGHVIAPVVAAAA
jgi:hypothetical protein